MNTAAMGFNTSIGDQEPSLSYAYFREDVSQYRSTHLNYTSVLQTPQMELTGPLKEVHRSESLQSHPVDRQEVHGSGR